MYLISLTKLKTHNGEVSTLIQKNVVMCSPINIFSKNINDRSKMHATDSQNASPKMCTSTSSVWGHRVRPDPVNHVKEYRLHEYIKWQHSWKDKVVIERRV